MTGAHGVKVPREPDPPVSPLLAPPPPWQENAPSKAFFCSLCILILTALPPLAPTEPL